ncbi:hypothetical protein IQ250_17650 [Pseudanabaenaceae cyanobacterium LEGE 13415]|nr:hypothetical protein [Pseudanabaenaceae cyanobacterium LEGE 13415]
MFLPTGAISNYGINKQNPDKEFFRKGNKHIPPGQLIQKERAIGRLRGKDKLKKAELGDWKKFKERNLSSGTQVEIIDPDRQLWEVETEHESFEAGRPGDVYKNATVTRAVDAETGELLYVKVSAAPNDFVPSATSK